MVVWPWLVLKIANKGGINDVGSNGKLTGLAFMNFNYMLAGSAGVNSVFLLLALLLVLAWKNAGWWGLDHFVLSALGSPGQAGSLVQRRVATGAQKDDAPPGI